MYRKFTYALCLGVVLGCVSSLVLGSVSFYFAVFGIIVCGIASLTRRQTYTTLCFIMLAGVLFGAVRVSLYEYQRSQETISSFDNQVVQIRGVAVAQPDIREGSVRVTLKILEINAAHAEGVVLALMPSFTQVEYGDTLVLQGKVNKAKNFTTDNGREFDYAQYLNAHSIDRLVLNASLQDRVVDKSFSFMRTLLRMKKSFEHAVERMLPEPHAALLEGILLGEKRALPSDVQHSFIVSSLVHVVVLSGYNISIVAEATLRVLSFLPATISLPVSGVMIILFALVTGAGAATVRACIMGVIALLARYFNRSADAMVALAVASSGMVLWNPLSSIYDPGFVLSVLATFGLITLSQWVELHISRVAVFRQMFLTSIRAIVASTVAVQIFILPALLYYTGIISLVALPANVLVLPMIPLTMLMGFVTGLLTLVHPTLAFLPSVATQLLLSWVLGVAHVSAGLSWSAVSVPTLPSAAIFTVYIPLTWWALHVSKVS